MYVLVCVCVCVCVCACVCRRERERERERERPRPCVSACLFVCLDEREAARASISHLPTYLRVFEFFTTVWWSIQLSVALIKCLVKQPEWLSDKTCLLAKKRLMCWVVDFLD